MTKAKKLAASPLHFLAVFELLYYIDSEGGTNNFEACYLYEGKYYACGTESLPLASKEAVLNAVVDKTRWYFSTPVNGNPGKTACVDPGPATEHDW